MIRHMAAIARILMRRPAGLPTKATSVGPVAGSTDDRVWSHAPDRQAQFLFPSADGPLITTEVIGRFQRRIAGGAANARSCRLLKCSSVRKDECDMTRQSPASLILVSILVSGCGVLGSDKSSSQGPTAPTPPNPAAPTSQNGCSATYTCAATDSNGAANPSTPTFDRLTLATGTSASCRAALHRNTPDPGIAIEFTIRNPQGKFNWQYVAQADNTLLMTAPGFGLASAAGPIQTTAFFNPAGIPNIKTGLEFTQNLVLTISTFSPITVVASCGVTVWGNVPSGS
jgi:hypothetical protein